MTTVRAVVSLVADTATAGVPVAARTGHSVPEVIGGCEVPPAEDGGPEDVVWVIFFMDDAISLEVQWFVDGTRRGIRRERNMR